MSEVTPVQDWKKKTGPAPLLLPSGKTCLARPAGVEAFLSAGMIPNSLMKSVSSALAKPGQKPEEMDMAELMADMSDDPKMLQDVFAMADNVTIHCVVEPTVHPAPDSEEDRQADLLYVDEVDLEDKLFILNFGMGGSRDLEAFRSATTGGVGPVPPSQDVRDEPKSITWGRE